MAGEVPSTPPAANQPAPPEDVYDIGVADEPNEAPSGAAAVGQPAAEVTPPPRDEAGRFVKHPKYLVRQAKKLGLTEDEIGDMDTDSLGEAVGQAMHWALEDRVQARQERPQESIPSTERREPDGIDWGTDEAGSPMKEQDYAPAVASLVKSHHSLAKTVKELQAVVQQLQGAEGSRQADSAYDRLDRVFSGLTDLHHAIGSGTRHELDTDGPEVARRQAVIDQARRMAGGDKATWPQLLAKVPAAARALFGTQRVGAADRNGEPPQPESNNEEVERWNGAATARPTHRVSPPPGKGRQAAVKKVAQLMRERGQLGEEISDEDFPG